MADLTASPAKRPPLLAGPALRARIDANRRLVSRFIRWRQLAWPATPGEHFAVLATLAHLANLGILRTGLFRQWEYDAGRHGVRGARPPVPPSQVEPALLRLLAGVGRGPALEPAAQVALVAQVEWEIGVGPLHPFHDGCGRVSRYFATLLSLWLDVPLPTHRSREAYFRAARGGPDAFASYYRGRTRPAGGAEPGEAIRP
jgi:hypothetical protein